MATHRVVAWRLAAALVVLSAPVVVGQVRDVPATPAAPPVTITGRVITGDADTPVPRVRVSTPTGNQAPVLTALDGSFQIEIPSGTGGLRLAKSGFAPVLVDRRALLPRTDLLVRMARAGAITGVVFDAFGTPAVNVSVRVRRSNDGAAAPGAATQYTTETDDLGEFRVGNLPAGRYTAVAGAGGRGRGAALDLIGGRGELRALAAGLGDQVNIRELLDAASAARIGGSGTPPADAGAARGRGGRGRGRAAASATPEGPVIEVREGQDSSATLHYDSPEALLSQALALAAGRVPPATGATVRGRVLTSEGRPVRGAVVRLTATSAGGTTRIATTDEAGQYEMDGVVPGAYRARANRSGLADAEYGQQRLLEAGRVITVSQGQAVRGIDITMPKPGVITGTITDVFGDPVEGLRVEAWQARYADGRRTLAPPSGARSRRTDDRGRYRLHGLLPGSYYVVATEPPRQTGRPGEDVAGARLFYPGANVASAASRITLEAGVDASGIDLTFSAPRGARVLGIATNSSGAPARGRVIIAVSERSGEPMLPLRTARLEDDGSFLFSDLSPGDYVVQVVPNAGPGDGRGGGGRGNAGGGNAGGSAGGNRGANAAGRNGGGRANGNAGGAGAAAAGGGRAAQAPAAGGGLSAGQSGAAGATGGAGAPGAQGGRGGQQGQRGNQAAGGAAGGAAAGGRGGGGQRGRGGNTQGRGAAAAARTAVVREFGMTYVTVDEGQTATVRIETAPGATITGQLSLEGDATDVSAGSFAFSARPAAADAAPLSGSRSVRAEVRDDWTFSMADLHGAIRIEGTRMPEGWFLKSAYVNGVNAVDEPASLTRGGAAPASVTVTFTSGAGTVTGTVLDDRRQPLGAFEVIAFASDPNRWFSRSPYVRRGSGSQDGSFTISGLPPGDYLVVALERIDAGGESGEWQSPDVLTRLSGAARRVRIGEGQTATVELRPGPGL